MSSKKSFTRRHALMLSGATAASMTFGLLPRPARSAVPVSPPLPIPTLIDAQNSAPVTLSLQNGRHRFGSGAAVASMGISSSYLGPVVRVRTGDTIPFRVENRLAEETTLHWHGLMVPSELDGGPHNTIKPGGVWTPEITIRQPPATTWFHPHPHGNTARQVYGGLAGTMIVTDGADHDRGLPTSYGVDDIPVVLQDKRFARNGELTYQPTLMDLMHGFQGDTLLVNGTIGPVAHFPAAFVRLRLLNAANARNFDLRFSDKRSFFVIAGDAGFLAEPVEVKNLVIAPAERYEVLIDFSDGRSVELVTAPDTQHGMGPGMMMQMRPPRRGLGGDTESLLRFSPDPALQATIRQLPRKLAALAAPDIKAAVTWRTFVLNPMMGMMGMGMAGMFGMNRSRSPNAPTSDHDHGAMAQMMGINGRSFSMNRVDFSAKLGTSEIWDIRSDAMAHPFHVHGASFRVLSNNGRKPPPEQSGWKDVVLVEDQAELLVRFDNPAPAKMPFMYHCHILEHEDHGMMGQFAVA
jgi:FtsP/CotA-like multicopper oxidase with cupredoxin domain